MNNTNCGIYKITNLINGKCYIGQSINIAQRWMKHRNASDEYPIHRAFKKYGIENFSFEILECCPKEKLNELEEYYIEHYDSYNNGYNLTIGGQGAKFSGVALNIEQVEEIVKLLKESDMLVKDIAQKFNVSIQTIGAINNGRQWRMDEEEYPIRENYAPRGSYSTKPQVKAQKYCIDCGTPISNAAVRCVKCNAKTQRVIKRPTKEQLEQILWDNNGNFTKIGKSFGVSDNAVRKWCKKYNLPSHSKDYKLTKLVIEKKPMIQYKVNQIDKDGNIISMFNSIREAERKTGITHIAEASDPKNTQRKTAGGYYWQRIV